jgi:hypothetical protein
VKESRSESGTAEMLIWPSEEVEEAMKAGRIVIHPVYLPLPK